jgi:hypothetical protein
MPDIRVLPRSLNPLLDESLPGYLLRLSHRLGQTPTQLAIRTGLATTSRFPSRIPPRLLLQLPVQVRDNFALATRLSPAEADRLTLSGLGTRYQIPPAEAGYRSATAARLARWISAPATRYCPRCLAGDGTAIQRAYGGAWRITWHLPVVFACTQHQQLLRHLCPHCDQPVHGNGAEKPSRLLPNMRNNGLHPLQCRASPAVGKGKRLPVCCGGRLDVAPASSSHLADTAVLGLQRRILDLLRSDRPETTTSTGQSIEPIRYLADLRLLTFLVNESWPASRSMSPSAAIAEAIDRHVEQQQHRIALLQEQGPAARTHRIRDTPPSDAAACAGLLSIGDQILALANPDEVRNRLRALVSDNTRRNGRAPWSRDLFRPDCAYSPLLQQACAPLVRTFTGASGRRARRDPIRQARFGPEHVPALLPANWHDRHFGHTDGVNPILLRRTAAVRLVQMIAGGSLGEAAQFLDINPTGKQFVSAPYVHRWAREQADPHQFDTALHTLAEELDASSNLVNYQRRRRALQTWAIDEASWNDLVSRLPPIPGPRQPELGDRKRQLGSIYVWVQITSGEHHFAPRPIEDAQPPEVQEAWNLRRNTIWHLFQRKQPHRHYADLKHLLGEHAEHVLDRIEAE